MTPLQRLKTEIRARLAQSLAAHPQADAVIPGCYVTAGHVLLQLLDALLAEPSVRVMTIAASFAKMTDNLEADVDLVTRLYGGQNVDRETKAYRVTILGRSVAMLARPDAHEKAVIYLQCGPFVPSLKGPDGDVPPPVQGDGYTIVGAKRFSAPDGQPDSHAYYVHAIAKGLVTVDGPGVTLTVESSGRLVAFGRSILIENSTAQFDKLDRREIDRQVSKAVEDYRDSARHHMRHPKEVAALRTKVQDLIDDEAKGLQPMRLLAVRVANGKTTLYDLVAYESLERGILTVRTVSASDYLYLRQCVRAHAKQHRRSLQDAATIEEQGGLPVHPMLAAFLHNRYGTDVADLMRRVEEARDQSLSFTDPKDNQAMVVLQLRGGELRGRFQIAPGATWEYTKIVFAKTSFPKSALQGVVGQRLETIADMTSIPGMADAVIAGCYERSSGFSITMRGTPSVPLEQALAQLQARKEAEPAQALAA